jgi:hypothetical protein
VVSLLCIHANLAAIEVRDEHAVAMACQLQSMGLHLLLHAPPCTQMVVQERGAGGRGERERRRQRERR